MFVVDTDVLVYAASEEFPQHSRCRDLLESWRASSLPWYLTWPIVFEFLRVVTHSNVLPNPHSVGEAWEFVEALLAAPALSMLAPTSRHPRVAVETFAEHPDLRGNLLHDAHTAILMREHGIPRIVTRDSDFHRFPFVEVIDPLREQGGEP